MILLHGVSVDHMDIFLLLVKSYQRHRRRTHEHAMPTCMPVAMADGNRGKTGGKKYFHLYIFDYRGLTTKIDYEELEGKKTCFY